MPETKTECKYADNDRYLKLAAAGDEEATACLMEANGGLVRGLAARFRGRGTDFEDLVQIGNIGMLKAIRSFDVTRGTAFSTYAVPLIIGEIRRHLRDDGLIKVGRRQKQLGASLLRAREVFTAENGREPQIHELAEQFNVSDAEAALSLEAISPVHSISESIGDGDDTFSLENILAAEDVIEKRTDQIALRESIESLPPVWKRIIFLRYFRELSQQQVADELGLTQVKISREEKKIVAFLREQMIK
ncbi:MAG: sigma-70 family RNA polymerase sigma factor [Clostridia bacterium]|nr:sigma-70 family RNA polymerase sigma factor [Clostridia bacterium]